MRFCALASSTLPDATQATRTITTKHIMSSFCQLEALRKEAKEAVLEFIEVKLHFKSECVCTSKAWWAVLSQSVVRDPNHLSPKFRPVSNPTVRCVFFLCFLYPWLLLIFLIPVTKEHFKLVKSYEMEQFINKTTNYNESDFSSMVLNHIFFNALLLT